LIVEEVALVEEQVVLMLRAEGVVLIVIGNRIVDFGELQIMRPPTTTLSRHVKLISSLFAGGPCLCEEFNSLVTHRAQVSAPRNKGNS